MRAFDPPVDDEGDPRAGLLAGFRRQWRGAALLFALALGGGATHALQARPRFRATVTIVTDGREPQVANFSDVRQAERGRDDDYRTQYTLLRSREIARTVAARLSPADRAGLVGAPSAGAPEDRAVDALLRALAVRAVPGSRTLEVSVDAPEPALAARVANTFGAVYVEQALERRYDAAASAAGWSEGPPSPIRVSDLAAPPLDPIWPRRRADLALGALAGAVGAGALVLARERRSRVLRSARDARVHLGSPLLAVIEDSPGALSAMLASLPSDCPRSFGVLAASLGHACPDASARCLLVTSSVAGEGRTSTALGLALTLARSGADVLLVDAHEQPRGAAAVLGLEGPRGAGEALRTVAPGLDVVTAPGTRATQPAALHDLVRRLRARYAWVVVDAPPLAEGAVPLALCREVDGVIAVVGAEIAPRAAIRASLEHIAATGARLLGVVLNRARPAAQPEDYVHYYGHYSQEEASARFASSRPEQMAR